MNDYKLVAPDVDRLLRHFERGYMNPSAPSSELTSAMEPLFLALKELAPISQNEEVKAMWLQIPRGTIEDYDSFESLVEYGEVKTREEYEALWLEDYPHEVKWYELVIAESFNRDGSLRFRTVALDNKTIINASMDEGAPSRSFSEDAAISLCMLLAEAVKVPFEKLRNGIYNEEVNKQLPYEYRTGVIKRSVLWEKNPAWKKDSSDGLSPETIWSFKKLLDSNINDRARIGRIKSFTANDFFSACAIGYKALGYDCSGLTPSELYLRYSDGRDEGLTGSGYGLNEGPGIAFDDPDAWNHWYFDKRGGGHPWEIIRGGNSTHVDLFVMHDKRDLDWRLLSKELSEKEYKERLDKAGYFFEIHGIHRPLEAVTFYIALSTAGLPVVIGDAKELLARFEGTDYVGIVPHHTIPRYCENMFPKCYGRVIDFIHVYDEEMEAFGSSIEWIPEEPARLIN